MILNRFGLQINAALEAFYFSRIDYGTLFNLTLALYKCDDTIFSSCFKYFFFFCTLQVPLHFNNLVLT